MANQSANSETMMFSTRAKHMSTLWSMLETNRTLKGLVTTGPGTNDNGNNCRGGPPWPPPRLTCVELELERGAAKEGRPYKHVHIRER